jgi:hypothetical protein
MTAEPLAERQPRIRMGKSWKSRRQRAELLAAIRGFEYALTGSPSEPSWRHGVAAELSRLRAAFNQHVELTEGPDGLYAEVVGVAPRLANQVSTLGREHEAVSSSLAMLSEHIDNGQLDQEPERVCALARQVLRELSRHRQRGADLVHEAFTTDIGGEN